MLFQVYLHPHIVILSNLLDPMELLKLLQGRGELKNPFSETLLDSAR